MQHTVAMKWAIYSTCLICCALFLSWNSAHSIEKNKVSYGDLGVKYSVIGPLGIELGKVVVLEVEKIELNVKTNPPMLRVKTINGKKLKTPIECEYRMLIINDRFVYKKTYKIKAYQDGSFTGTPHEVLKDIMFQTSDYYFEASLVVFKYLDEAK